MNRQELIEAISAETAATKVATGAFLDAMIHTVQNTVAKGDKVALAGFGTFESVAIAARAGRNPSTGAVLKIAATVRPKFKASSVFSELVKKSAGKKKSK